MPPEVPRSPQYSLPPSRSDPPPENETIACEDNIRHFAVLPKMTAFSNTTVRSAIVRRHRQRQTPISPEQQFSVNAREVADVVEAIRDLTGGGAHVSVDALGHPQTCFNSVANLRKRGRHVQVGLMLADHCHPPVPMDRIIAHELEVLGSHGMQAHKFEEIFRLIGSGRLQPAKLVSRTISLEESLIELPAMNSFEHEGVTVIDRF